MTNNIEQTFASYVKEEYKSYPGVAEEVLDFHNGLGTDLEKEQFELHIREHHNHAFGGKDEWYFELKARLSAITIDGNTSTVLFSAYDAPIEDGDVVSKNGLRWCRELMLIARIATVNGSLNAVTGLGGRVVALLTAKALDESDAKLTNYLNDTSDDGAELKAVLKFLEVLSKKDRMYLLTKVREVADTGGVKYCQSGMGLTVALMRDLDLLELNEDKDFLTVTKLGLLIAEYFTNLYRLGSCETLPARCRELINKVK